MVGKRPGGSMRRLAVLVTTFGLARRWPARRRGAGVRAVRRGTEGDRHRRDREGDPHRGGCRRRQPVRAQPVPGRGERRQGRRRVRQLARRDRGPQGRARRHRLAAQPHEDAERGHHRVPERLRAGRHGCRVHDHDRGRGQLPGPGGQGDRPARLRRLRHRRAAVLTGCVPREPAPARVLHQGRPPADVLRRLGGFEVLREARGNEAARALPREQRQRGGDSSTGSAARLS